jgi:hypothetical protein
VDPQSAEDREQKPHKEASLTYKRNSTSLKKKKRNSTMIPRNVEDQLRRNGKPDSTRHGGHGGRDLPCQRRAPRQGRAYKKESSTTRQRMDSDPPSTTEAKKAWSRSTLNSSNIILNSVSTIVTCTCVPMNIFTLGIED